MAISPHALLAWVDAIGWTLLHFLWQGAALGAGYGLLRPLCRGVAARYRLGISFLVLLVACPVFTLAFVWPTHAAASAAAIALAPQTVVAGAAATTGEAGLEALLPWLVAAWFAGATIIAVRAFAHWRHLSWLVQHAAIPLPDCADMLARLCARFGVTRRVRLLGSMGVNTPMLVGWVRPVILLPISMLSGFTPQQIELIIAHELGHVRRWDYLANLVQVVIETILFYHPVVHWISRDVRDARESCCDDLVLALGTGSPVVYASTLADLEQLRHDHGLAAPALAATGGVLLDRIRRIVGVQGALYDPLPRNSGWPIVLLAAVGAFVMLRLHVPVPDVATILQRAPAASVAAISGNSRLAAPMIPATPAPIVVHPATTSATPTPAEPVPATRDAVVEPVRQPLRPRITVAAAVPDAVPQVGNIRERLATLPPMAAPAVVEQRAISDLPVVLRRVQPEYPVREKIRGVTGSVELRFAIDRGGSVDDVSVVQSTPENVFDRVAVTALKQWRFAASGEAGRYYTQTFTFALGTPAVAPETCREVIGSHICRHMVAGEETDR